MKFSDVRISQLHRERVEREAAFARSRAALERSVKEKIRPMNIIREHPGLLAGAAMSALSFLGLGRKVASFNGNGKGRRPSGLAGMLLKTLSFGGGIAARTLSPVASTAVRLAVNSLFRRFRRR